MRQHLIRKLLILHIALFFGLPGFAQNRTISGTVMDSDGNPLAGATITIKGTSANTTTNNLGTFRLPVPPQGKTLVITYVDMQNKEVELGSENTYKITLAPQKGLSLQLRFNDVPLEPGESFDMPVSIYGDPDTITEGQTAVTLNVVSEDGKYKVSKFPKSKLER